MNPKVSIIIPIYNTEKYLRDCLDSVKNQTLREWECICVDDGSTDSSKEIIASYVREDKRFQLICKENGGQSSARNVGIDRAIGEYIYYLDSDDSIHLNALERLYSRAKEEDLDIVLFDMDIVYEREELKGNHSIEAFRLEKYETCSGREMFIKQVKNADYLVNVWLQFIRRKYVMESGLRFVEGMIHEDVIYTFHNLIHAPLVGHLPERLYIRRVREDSTITGEVTGYHFWSMYKCYTDALKYAMTIDDEEMKDALRLRAGVILKAAKERYLAIAEKPLSKKDAERINALDPIERMLMLQFGFVFRKIYQFPEAQIEKGTKLILYGAGDVGRDYFDFIKRGKDYEVVLWVDTNYERLKKEGLPVHAPQEIQESQYDYILISMTRKRVAKAISEELISRGIDKEKIIWYSPEYLFG